MGSRRDRIANEKIIAFHNPGVKTPGTLQSGVVDLRSGTPVTGAAGGGTGREIHTNILLALQIGGEWAQAGTIDIRVFTGNTSTALTLFAIAAQCIGSEGENLYLVELRDLQRYMRVDLVIANANVILGMIGNAERSRREPVYQEGTEKAVTYQKNPASF